MPPTLEGYGVIDAACRPRRWSMPATAPSLRRPKRDLNAIYVDTLMALLKAQSRSLFP